MTPPFRADHVGSLLRPIPLREARAAKAEGRMSPAELRAVEDRHIGQVAAQQRAIGLKAVTDGEYRRAFWHFDFLAGLGGVEMYRSDQGIQFQGGQTAAYGLKVTGPIRYEPHPFVADFKMLAGVAGAQIPKLTIPSPSVQRFTVPAPTPAIQPTVDEAEDAEISRREEAVAASSRFEEITFKVPIGDMGVGLIIVNDPSSSSVVVKGFRSMPYKKENPSQAAGMRVGDVIKAIDDVELLDHNHAVNLIRASLFEIKICVLRIKVNA